MAEYSDDVLNTGGNVKKMTKVIRDISERKSSWIISLREDHKLSYRNISEITGVSHEQVHRLVKAYHKNNAKVYKQPSVTGWFCQNKVCRVRVYEVDHGDSKACPLCGQEGIDRGL